MAWSIDARVPVRLGALAEATAGDALLIEGDQAPAGFDAERFDLAAHPPGCDCCLPRSGAASALARLFQRRARGEAAFFRRVLAVTATPDGDLAVWTALRTDPLVSARFRLDAEA